MEIAILLPCHNRKSKTLACLNSLYKAIKPNNLYFDIFLVDDGSTDMTTEAVKTNFPNVNIISGNGNLFWNRGMHLAWKTATNLKTYDYYMWLNDDVSIMSNGLVTIIDNAKEKPSSIICGVMQSALKKDVVTYGGKNFAGKIIEPNGKLTPVSILTVIWF